MVNFTMVCLHLSCVLHSQVIWSKASGTEWVFLSTTTVTDMKEDGRMGCFTTQVTDVSTKFTLQAHSSGRQATFTKECGRRENEKERGPSDGYGSRLFG